MAIHHLGCGTMCPATIGTMVCHCLLVETGDGLVLVDTGFGTGDVKWAARRFSPLWRALARPSLEATDCAVHRVAQLGYDPADVRHVVVTHLDFDHAGGLPDFPNATVHVHARELEAARARASRFARQRYLPDHLAHGPRIRTYDEGGEPWFGFDGIRALGDRDTDVLLIPLPGHSEGHSAVAVRDGDRWLLHCGDAYFHRGALRGGRVPRLLRLFERRAEVDRASRRSNVARLAELAAHHADEVTVFSSHDPRELAALRDAAAVTAPSPAYYMPT